jgi:hypothetical protein
MKEKGRVKIPAKTFLEIFRAWNPKENG